MNKSYSTIALIFSSVPKTLCTSSNVTKSPEFLGRRSLLVVVPDSHEPPSWRLHMIWSDVHVERPLGVKRFENCRVSPYCSCRAGSTELTSCHPSLTSGVNSLTIHRAQTFLVQLLYNECAQNRHRPSSPFCRVRSWTAVSYYGFYTILPFSSFEWLLCFDNLTKYSFLIQ
jgi:hypothetical protein